MLMPRTLRPHSSQRYFKLSEIFPGNFGIASRRVIFKSSARHFQIVSRHKNWTVYVTRRPALNRKLQEVALPRCILISALAYELSVWEAWVMFKRFLLQQQADSVWWVGRSRSPLKLPLKNSFCNLNLCGKILPRSNLTFCFPSHLF